MDNDFLKQGESLEPVEATPARSSDQGWENMHETMSTTNTAVDTAGVERKILLRSLVPLIAMLVLISTLALWRILSYQPNELVVQNAAQPVQQLDVSDAVSTDLDPLNVRPVRINGQIIATQGIVLNSQSEPENALQGQLYYDSTDNVVRIYNGENYSNLATLQENEDVCIIGGDCGFSSVADLQALSASLADAQAQIASLSGNSSVPPQSNASYFSVSGNQLSTIGRLGSTNNVGINLITNNQNRVQIGNTGNVNIDGSSFFVDALNNRVGIGTEIPSSTLNVLGISTLNGNVITGELTPLTPGGVNQGIVNNDVLTIFNQASIYNDSQSFISIGLDNLPRFVFIDNSYSDVRYVRCLDQYCQTFNNTLISTNPDGQDAATIQIGSDGLARIVYINWSDPQEIHFVQCLNDNCTSRNDSVVASRSSYPFYEVSFALDSSDNAYIVFTDYNDDEVNLASCTNADCSSLNTTVINSFSYGSTYGIEVANDDFARIAYYDNSEILFVKCTSVDCTSNNTEIVANGLAGSSYYTNLVLDTSGNGRIAYSDRNGTGLKLITCLNDTCSSSSSTIIDSTAIDNQISLDIDLSNNVRLAYQLDPYDTGLNYMYCNNQDCSINTVSTIDTVGGYPLSMATGSDGFSRIIYTGVNGDTISLVTLGTVDGQNSEDPGTSIGNISNSFGQAYLQGVNARSATQNALISINQLHSFGQAIDFRYQDNLAGSIGVGDSRLYIRDTLGENLIDIDTGNKIFTLEGNGNINGNFQVSGTLSAFSVSPDSHEQLKLQSANGSSLMSFNSLSRSLALGSSDDSATNQLESINISSSESYSTNTLEIDIADIDADGYDDLLTNFGVFRNEGNGSYTYTGYGVNGASFNRAIDVNNDGYLDIILHGGWSVPSTERITVLINDGVGNFLSPATYPAGVYSGVSNYDKTIDFGDFNSDGFADIAAVGYNTNQISILLNNGDGTFGVSVEYSTGSYPSSISVNDFDQDGFDDVAVTNATNHNVSVFINNGDGTFAARVNYSLSTYSWPLSLESADLNGDSYPDIVATRQNLGQASVFLNNGDGTFAAKVDYQMQWNARKVRLLDDNNDGSIDIFVMHDTVGMASIWHNNGDGTFTLFKEIYTGGAKTIDVLDYDKDGYTDYLLPTNSGIFIGKIQRLAVSEPPLLRLYSSGRDVIQVEGAGEKQVFRVDGEGNITVGGSTSVTNQSFEVPAFYAPGNFVENVISADLNNDNIQDIVTSNRVTPGQISVYISNGDGTFDAQVDYATSSNPGRMNAVDLDNDNDLDIVANGGSVFSVFINNGDGTFLPRVNYASGTNWQSYFSTEDLNNDGFADVVRSNYQAGSISVFINNGDGTFAPKTDYNTGQLYINSLIAKDIDNNNSIDVVVSSSSGIVVYSNDGSGNFTQTQAISSVSNILDLNVENLDTDNYADIVVARSSGDLYFYTNNGSGIFNATPSILVIDPAVTTNTLRDISLSDIDSDGDKDILTTHYQSNYPNPSIGVIYTILNNGSGVFLVDKSYQIGEKQTNQLDIHDIDNDSIQEVIVLCDDGTYLIFENDGSGGLYDLSIYKVGKNLFDIAFGDFDDNGSSDLAIADGEPYLGGLHVSFNKIGKNYTPNKFTILDNSGSSELLKLTANGQLGLQNAIDSMSSFSVNNSSGDALFSVDTLNSSVYIASPTDNTQALTVQNSNGDQLFGIDTQNSQTTVASPTDNTAAFQVQNAAGTAILSVDTQNGVIAVVDTVVSGTLTINGHVVTGNESGSTTVAAGAGAGASPTVFITGNDTSGTVDITTGTGSGTGILATITFSASYTGTPRVVLTPADGNGATLQYFYNATTNSFDILTNSAPTDATQYQYTYWVVE